MKDKTLPKLSRRSVWLMTAVILSTSIFLKFYRYADRFALAYDQARDVIVSHYALANGLLPQWGPFSSAAPFQFGAVWYWFVMFGDILIPGTLGPWIMLSITFVLVTIILMVVGYVLDGVWLSLIVGLLVAFSPAQNTQSTDLTNPSIISFISSLSILSAVMYGKTKEMRFIFMLGMLTSVGASLHISSLSLGALYISLFLIYLFSSIYTLPYYGSGFILGLLPYIIADRRYSFINIKNIIYYFFHGPQNVTYEELGRRWLTYIGQYWPGQWAFITGGWVMLGYLLMGLVAVSIFFGILKKKISKEWLIIVISLGIMFFQVRYVKAPLYSGYMVFTHSFVLLLTSYAVYRILKLVPAIGILLLCIVTCGSFAVTWENIIHAQNFTNRQIIGWYQQIVKSYPNTKFSFYDRKLTTTDKSIPLVLKLMEERLIADNGKKIGFTIATYSGQYSENILCGENPGYQAIDLSATSEATFSEEGWSPINPRNIYESIQTWREIKNK